MKAVDDFLVELCEYAITNGDVVKCQGVLERIIGYTNNKRWEISNLIACSYRDQGLYSKAYKNFFKARNVEQICASLEQVMQAGYASEQDLFVARATLEMLIKSAELSKARQLRENFRTKVPQTMLLNFVDFFIECIECQEFQLVKQMANVDYNAELKREPNMYEKVNAICEKYFNQGIKQ